MSQSPSASVADTDPSRLRDYLSAWLAIGEMSRQGSSWSGRERNTVFLNPGDGRFADVSALSGADYPDDGRAVVSTDWDGDGDLDLWVASRTSPRVRFLLNRCDTQNESVSFGLRGTSANRDAIGARLRLRTSAGEPPRIQTLRAGEGFLAQSSKWVHFGLSDGVVAESVEVDWPGGEREHFSGITAGGRYLLEQGSGVAQPVDRRQNDLLIEPRETEPVMPASGSHIRLTSRPPLPPLPYESFAGDPRTVPTGDGAILLNLWASWCLPCVAELSALEAHREDLAAGGLEILALSVDEDLDRARALLEQVEPSFEVGVAPAATLEILDILQKALLEERRPLVLPMSFLIDSSGHLAVLYKGAVDAETLFDDLEILSLGEFDIRAATAPLAGRWATLPTPFPTANLVAEFTAFDRPEVAAIYQQLAAGAALPATPVGAQAVASRLAQAFDLLRSGDRQQAEAILGHLVEELAAHLGTQADDTAARNQIGLALLGLGRPGAALQAFEQVIERDPANAPALSNAAALYWHSGRREEAREFLERLEAVDPEAAAELRRTLTETAVRPR